MRFHAYVLALLACPAAFAGNVLVVGPAPTQIHVLQDALILAQEGDVILVKGGNYSGFRTTGRSVSVVAENGAVVQLQRSMRVIDNEAGTTVVLSGLRARPSPSSMSLPEERAALYVNACAGQVVAQDCQLSNVQALSAAPFTGQQGLFVRSCAGVSLVRSTITAVPSSFATGIEMQAGALVALHQVSAQGSDGHAGTGFPYGDGFPGHPGLLCFPYPPATAPACFLLAVNSTFLGGAGGAADYALGSFGGCGMGGTGGTGLNSSNPNGLVMLGGIAAFGGAGGPGTTVCPTQPPQPGIPGTPTTTSGPVTNLTGPARLLSGTRLVRDNANITLSFQGVPGERVELGLTRRHTSFVPLPKWEGVLHLSGPVWRPVGTTPPGGTLTLSFTPPDLPLSDPGTTYFAQARFVNPTTGTVRLSNLHAIVEVDQTF